jgi:hypothetical protein
MYMRVSWSRVEPGKWDDDEAAYCKGAGEAGRRTASWRIG